jgi:NADPH-dependent 2,4-dienoyl-CoA reductase/sulfur reductase-like enzyme
VADYGGDANDNPVYSGRADEPVTVTMASPGISTSPQPASAAVGSSIADKATVSGGYQPSGTVTFKLYNNATATGSPLFTDTKTLSSGSATSGTYAPTALGTYYWVATYNGDASNTAVSSGAAAGPVTVTKASPGISTTPQPASAAVGSSIADQATVSGGYQPSGTVTFKLYNNSSATGSPLFTDTKTLSSGSATSASYATTALGTVYWVATYNGDTNNNSVSSGTAASPVTVTKASPGISTTPQPASATVGSSIAAGATVSGGSSPSGTVTFKLYNNSSATGSPLFTDTKTLSSGGATSGSYATTATGTFYWVATYNGDTNNNSVSSGTAASPVTVTKASPGISNSQQPASAVVGSSIADQATVSSGYQPTGTVTFKLYNNANGTGSPVFTDTESLLSGSATSASYATVAAGTLYWVTTYNGDSNNNSVSSGTASAPVTVTKAAPGISSSAQPASAAVGSSIAGQATVSGGYQPSGTITFKLYGNSTATGTPLFTDTKTLSSGSATSGSYATTATGTFYWVAKYNGDANNSSISSGTAAAPVTVGKTSPEISTTQQPASAPIGALIADKATVSGAYQPTGTVTFKLYDNPAGTGTPLLTSTKTVVNGSATSASFATKAIGIYYWVASYSGDAHNGSASTGTADEPVTVTKATPSLVTKRLPGSAKVKTAITDQVTVTRGYKPTGTVTFQLFRNSTATGAPVFTSTKALVRGTAISAKYKPKTTGTYYWVVTYNGDAKNNAVSSGSASQPVSVHR